MARFTESEKVAVWDRWQGGESMRSIGRGLGRESSSVRTLIEDTGGVRPLGRQRHPRHLSFVEREEISRGVAAGESLRHIARRLGRAPSTVCREVTRNGGRGRYRAQRADRAALGRARRPKMCKLVANPVLLGVVEEKLAAWWAPEQIAGWLREAYPLDPEMWVSHETIYLSLFVQGRGALRHELTTCLRTHRAMRRPRTKRVPTGKGQIRESVMISERPAEVADRAVPGHWGRSTWLWTISRLSSHSPVRAKPRQAWRQCSNNLGMMACENSSLGNRDKPALTRADGGTSRSERATTRGAARCDGGGPYHSHSKHRSEAHRSPTFAP